MVDGDGEVVVAGEGVVVVTGEGEVVAAGEGEIEGIMKEFLGYTRDNQDGGAKDIGKGQDD